VQGTAGALVRITPLQHEVQANVSSGGWGAGATSQGCLRSPLWSQAPPACPNCSPCSAHCGLPEISKSSIFPGWLPAVPEGHKHA
jgi:hypothetical protein